MPRLPSVVRRTGPRKAIPWLAYYEIARTGMARARSGWYALTPAERQRLQVIIRDSHGRPSAVPADQRREVRQLVAKAIKGAASV
jgi:hypothetical protein